MAPSDDEDESCLDAARRSWIASSAGLGAASGADSELSVDDVTLPGEERRATMGSEPSEPSDEEATVPGLLPGGQLRRLDDGQVLQIAEGIRAETGALPQGDPRVLAFRLGIDVVPGFPDAGETPTATEAVFAWHPDPRERGMRVYCALAHSFFLARRIAYGPGDAWALAVELALPAKERWIGRMTLIFTQRFCPKSVICAYVSAQ
jgi:hypothetical protein